MSLKETGLAGGSLQARSDDQLSGSISSKDTAPAAAVKFHPLADIFPLMEGEEFDALVADIKANGLNENIVLYEGKVLDGRNRYRACMKAGIEPHFCRLLKSDDPAAYVISANIHRRHLTAEQKRELIAKLIKAQPEKSNRQIAKTAKVDHKTVGAARAELEGRGEIPHVETTTDTKGRKQPGKKKKKRKVVVNDPELLKALHEGRVGDACLVQMAEDSPQDRWRAGFMFRADTAIADAAFGDWSAHQADQEMVSRARQAAAAWAATAEYLEALCADTPEASAETMKAKFAADDDGLDVPGFLRRAPKAAAS
jgi:ParB-like nuclease domain